MSFEALMTQEEVAEALQVSVHTLIHWRRPEIARGPDYMMVGRAIRYRRSDIERWLETRRRPNGAESNPA